MSRNPRWLCTSIIAGITVFPVRSTRAAPVGTSSSPLRPTRVNRVSSTMNAAFSIGGLPSPVISRAPSNTVTLAGGAWASGRGEQALAVSAHARAITYDDAFVNLLMDPSCGADCATGAGIGDRGSGIRDPGSGIGDQGSGIGVCGFGSRIVEPVTPIPRIPDP